MTGGMARLPMMSTEVAKIFGLAMGAATVVDGA